MTDSSRRRAGRHLPRTALAGAVLATAGAAGLALSAAGYRLGWWPVVEALRVAEWAVYAAAAGLLLSLLGALLSLRRGRRRGLLPALLGLVLSLPVVAAALQWEDATRRYPPINDVSTDTADPPVFWDMPTPSDYPAGNAPVQQAAYPDLAPLALPLPPQRAFALAAELVRDRGWELVAEEAGEGRIEAVARSFLYGFPDEVVIRVGAADGGSRVDLRSRSRIGRIDRGVNAARIRAFLAALRERAASEP
ncbi:Protein of unknown function [Tistlia consotensis]|uniref:DUF1499 domain-containing protein n=1 Tax=Tistlia consotensis USBA 355 TaxID=560819 RepID=A0A1Y6B8X1_9PROT|nr:DUF1499 domain-containing protein [Tistlia consotensis]SME97132.1 Protein of unknown function [Tistlia consotensis USBA 355]SNR56542.1 Protein of unknown function [Tistlia consotensis]